MKYRFGKWSGFSDPLCPSQIFQAMTALLPHDKIIPRIAITVQFSSIEVMLYMCQHLGNLLVVNIWNLRVNFSSYSWEELITPFLYVQPYSKMQGMLDVPSIMYTDKECQTVVKEKTNALKNFLYIANQCQYQRNRD